MPLINELQKIGLSDKEAKVYLATLELAQASVQKIAQKSNVKRATTYVILESLIEKGLCSTIQQDKKTLYIANDPDTLEGIFEIQKKEIDEQKKNFTKVLPDLHLIFNRQEDKPTVKFFEGKQGMFNCMEEFLSIYKDPSENVRMVYNADLINKNVFPEELNKYKEIRLKRKIKTKVLYNMKSGEKKNTADGNRVKLDEKIFPVSCDFAVYGDYIRLITLGKKVSAILIKDKNIATTLKTVFDLAWIEAKRRKD